MKIGILGSLAEPVSPAATGGTEVFCALLTKGLVQLGHEVFVFGAAGSQVAGAHIVECADTHLHKIKDTFVKILGREYNPEEKEFLISSLNTRLLLTAKMHEQDIDIFHENTTSWLVGASSDLFKKPIVTTTHMLPSPDRDYTKIPTYITKPTNTFVAISEYTRAHLNAPARLIYNGIDIDTYNLYPTSENYMVWLGRVSSAAPKGLKEAIIVAEKMNQELHFSASISDHSYYAKEIEPILNEQTKRIDVSVTTSKNALLGMAKVALLPIQWEEPFGLVFVEAMASGTPVISTARGAAPEVIQDGVTGFIVNPSDEDIRGNYIIKKTGIEGLCEAVERIYSLSTEKYAEIRKACRDHVNKHFRLDRMAKDYETLYVELINK